MLEVLRQDEAPILRFPCGYLSHLLHLLHRGNLCISRIDVVGIAVLGKNYEISVLVKEGIAEDHASPLFLLRALRSAAVARALAWSSSPSNEPTRRLRASTS